MFTELMYQRIFSYLSFQEHMRFKEYEVFRPYLYINHVIDLQKECLCRGCQKVMIPILKDLLDDHYGCEDEYLHHLFLYEEDFQVQTEEERIDYIYDNILRHLIEFYQTSLYEVLFEERFLHLITSNQRCLLHNIKLLPFLNKIEKRCIKKYIQMIENH